MLHENAPFENGKPTTPLVLGKYVAVVAFTLTGYIEFDDVRVDQQAPYPICSSPPQREGMGAP
jgi:hypothetical protein